MIVLFVEKKREKKTPRYVCTDDVLSKKRENGNVPLQGERRLKK